MNARYLVIIKYVGIESEDEFRHLSPPTDFTTYFMVNVEDLRIRCVCQFVSLQSGDSSTLSSAAHLFPFIIHMGARNRILGLLSFVVFDRNTRTTCVVHPNPLCANNSQSDIHILCIFCLRILSIAYVPRWLLCSSFPSVVLVWAVWWLQPVLPDFLPDPSTELQQPSPEPPAVNQTFRQVIIRSIVPSRGIM